MPRRLVVTAHLDPNVLRTRARAAPAADRVRWLAMRLVAEGRPASAVGSLVGFSPEWVRALVHRSNAGGPAALADRRRGTAGGRPLLSPEQQEALRTALAGPAPGGGIWTCRSVAAWIGGQIGRPVGEQRGWEWMRRLGFTPQRPRPREARADPEAQAAFKKGGLQAAIDAVAAAHPTAAVAAWAVDEHRLGLLPVVRRVWAPRGCRPIAPVRRTYAWLYVYGFVRPRTGQTWWCLLPTVSVEAMTLALAAFARDEGIGPGKRAVLAIDNAGWHTSGRLGLPEGVHLAFLPPYSPELQPAERLWGPVDEVVANRTFADLGQLQDTLAGRCRELERHRTALKTRCRYHWWPHERRPKNQK